MAYKSTVVAAALCGVLGMASVATAGAVYVSSSPPDATINAFSSYNYQYTFAATSGSAFTGANGIVDWGDGNTTNFSTTSAVLNLAHTYNAAGLYTIMLSGNGSSITPTYMQVGSQPIYGGFFGNQIIGYQPIYGMVNVADSPSNLSDTAQVNAVPVPAAALGGMMLLLGMGAVKRLRRKMPALEKA